MQVSLDYGATWGPQFAPTMAATTLDGGRPSIIDVGGILLLSTRASTPTKVPQFFLSEDKGDTWDVVFYPYDPSIGWNTYSAFVLRNDGKVLDVTGLHYSDSNGDLGSTVITIQVAGASVVGVEADLIGGVTWTTADGIPDYLTNHGFYAEVQQTPPYIPALSDGSAAADGNPITNPPASMNGSGSKYLMTDATLLGAPSFWSANGITFDKKPYSPAWTGHINGAYGLWIQWKKSSTGVCLVWEWVQYPYDKTYTPFEYAQLKQWAEKYTDECGAGIISAPL